MIPDSSSVGFRRDYPRGLRLCKNSLTFACFFFFFLPSGRIPKFNACIQLPTAEAACV